MPPALTLRRLAYRLAYRGLQVLWFLTGMEKRGVKCLACDGDRVLLVRHTYGPRVWDVPGGSLKRNEPPHRAATREMSEELGLDDVAWQPIGEVRGTVGRRRDRIECFTAQLTDPVLRVDAGELAHVRWFPREALPADRGPYVGQIVARAALG